MISGIWGSHAARVLVSASSPKKSLFVWANSSEEKVRDDEDVIASTRPACTPQITAAPQANLIR